MVIMMQVIWCCRMRPCGLVVLGFLQVVCALLSFGAGIYILVAWPNDGLWCNVWRLNIHYEGHYYDDDDDYHHTDSVSTTTNTTANSNYECNYIAYATVEFIATILWLVAAYGPLQFVYSGKLQMHELKLRQQQQEGGGHGDTTNSTSATTTTDAIEMGMLRMEHNNTVVAATAVPAAAPAAAMIVSDYGDDEKK